MAKIIYIQMPAPWKLSQQIPALWAKARMQKPQGGDKFLVQIPGGAWWGGMVMDEIDTCISGKFFIFLDVTALALAQIMRETGPWKVIMISLEEATDQA